MLTGRHGDTSGAVTALEQARQRAANGHGPPARERLVSHASAGRCGRVALATESGNQRAEDGTSLGANGRPGYARTACEASPRHLGRASP